MGTFGSRSRGPVTGQVYLVEPRRFAIGDRLPLRTRRPIAASTVLDVLLVFFSVILHLLEPL